MINKTLLVSDMDGTLLDSDSLVSNENHNALVDYVAVGGQFTVATGRMRSAVARYLPRIPMNHPAILYNGSMIYDFAKEKILWKLSLPDEAKEIVRQIMGEFPEAALEIYHGDELYFVGENAETDEHKLREEFSPHCVSLDEVPLPWIKAIIAWEPKKLAQVEKWLKGKKLNFRFTYSEPCFIELLNNDATKGTALVELAKITGFDIRNVIAVGDNLNDMEMIASAGTGIAVANAHPELKRIADICGPENNDNAVARIVRCLLNKRDLKTCLSIPRVDS
jgi:Cof subfamily protein (haloacid dehalogenase superfamily)